MMDEQTPPEHRPRRLGAVWGLALLLLAAGAGYAALRGGVLDLKFLAASTEAPKSKHAQDPVPVKAQIAQQRDEPVILNGLGVVQAWNTVTVRSRVDGAIEKLHFTEGATVHEGDKLVELDQRPFIAARDQAVAKVGQDKAQLVSAEADLDRTTTLNKNGYASRQLLDQQTATVKQLQAQIAADQAAVENAETQLGYTVIKAPMAGRLGLRSIDVGNIVHATDPGGVVTITQVQPIAVVFTAPEQYLDQIVAARKAGAPPVAALSTDGKDTLAKGELSYLDNSVDTSTGTIRLKARFDNEDGRLWPGQSVGTRLTISTIRDAVVVGEGAVLRGPYGPFVYVVKADRSAEMRSVTVSQIQDGWAVIAKGVTPGELVVTSGQYKVQPGSLLDVAVNDTKAANAGGPRRGLE